MEIFFLLLLGLLVGSFLNVVIFRIEREESFVGGRSRCLACGHQLVWYDNIPLFSFLWLQGKCRYCKIKLSWQYPLVELATAILFVGSFWIVGPGLVVWEIAAMLFLLATLSFVVLITVYDLRFSLIPNSFLWGLNISTFGYLLSHWVSPVSFAPSFLPGPVDSLVGAVVVGTFFFFFVWFSKETWMGWGDVWLGVWGGMLTGILLAQVFITLSFSLGAIVGLALIYARQKTLKAEVPFAPYILAAGVLILIALYKIPAILQFLSPWLPATM